jgi:hypothetical protein
MIALYARSQSDCRDNFLALETSAKNRRKKNMASSSEAFEKFSQWNKRKTWLNVTEIERGEPERMYPAVRIDAFEEDSSEVGILDPELRGYKTFDVEGAEFSIEPDRVVVSRDDVEWLIFEEMPEEEEK